ncbi:MAG TPA: hypothetical protein VFH61_05400 [Thermoleophilia bacterium]|nr:hypothetical protein [Thermoleophilia bacterium]
MDWQIQARSKGCMKCGTPFGEGDPYYCLLAEVDDGLARSDYCQACWQEVAQETLTAPTAISTWRGVVPPKLMPPDEPIKRTTAETLLGKYLHSTGADEKNFCFILGLILERKRILKQRQVMHDEHRGAKLVVYEHARSGESYVIEDPGLSLAELEQVHGQVAAILERERISAS